MVGGEGGLTPVCGDEIEMGSGEARGEEVGVGVGGGDMGGGGRGGGPGGGMVSLTGV